MFGKPPVTALQEYCAKKRFPLPVYECMDAEDGSKSFICQVRALNESGEGVGRSKKEAKHDAAAHLIKKLKFTHPDIEDIPQALHESIPMSDAVVNLRDLCIQQDHPLPSFEVIQQAGPPEAPEFTVECRVATIKRYATATTKKAAKQKAAQKIIDIIQSFVDTDRDTQVVKLADVYQNEDEINRKCVKTYREYIDSDIKQPPGTKLCNRHDYFKKIDPELKKEAFKIINSTHFFSDKERVHHLFKALCLQYKTQSLHESEGDNLIFLEVVCDIDVVFAGSNDEIYRHILEYFIDML